ncbi:MAG: twin-arginine translocase subunit TatC [Bacteroidales bacterium]|nr:twin-arginine translocase subunit TatC [Bacteroidales bacterium]MCF8333147.1 twin-arginine translocase subunit TatC [Bacteroidales bacterium]
MAEKISTKKNKKRRQDDNKMGFWDHLEELRWHLFRSFIAIFVLAIGAFLARHIIFDLIILAPKSPDFITNRFFCSLAEYTSMNVLCINDTTLEVVNLKMSGQFLIHLYVSIITGVIVAIPYIIAEIWAFIRPALYPNEKKHSTGAIFVTSFLFLVGILFSYFLIVPLTVNFLGSYQVSDTVQNTISLSSYIGTVVSLTFAVGLVFEMPVFVYFLTKVGMLTPQFMRRNRKYMIVIILVLAAIITPADIFSQILISIPLFGLYEFSIIISQRLYNKQMEEEAPEAM